MKYTPTRTSYNARYTFSAKEKDCETGYSYFGARYYSSDLSIWLSVDPLADKYPSMSPYTYCANNPVKLVDPNGEEVVNAHERPMKAAQDNVNYWSAELSKCEKGSKEYKSASNNLKQAQQKLDRETSNYTKTQQAIDEFKSKMPDEFNQMDNLEVGGSEINVYVSVKNFGGPEQEGQCVIDHGGFNVNNPRLGLTGKGVEVHLNMGCANLAKILAHEFGHISYEVNNSADYMGWLKDNNHFNEKGYGGHDNKDPSGIRAREWETKFSNCR